MDITGYYDIATKRFTFALDDNASVTLPNMVAGEDITVRVKFKRTREGVADEIRPTVTAMKAMLGVVDARPSSGELKIEVDGLETAEFTYDPAAEDPETPATLFENILKDAIQDLAGITAVSVEKWFDSYIVSFTDDATIQRVINVTHNTLLPGAFLRIREYLRGGKYYYEFRLVKAPVGYTNTFELGTGPIPQITTLREGGEVDDTKWSEIQKLFIPPSFTGTFRLKRGQLRTDPMSRDSTLDEITELVDAIKDDGGVFRVEDPIDNTFYFYFEGDMEGINQDPIEVEIFDEPQTENVVSFSTKTRTMAEVMMEADQAILILEVYATIEDLEDDSIQRTHCVLRQQVGIREAVEWDELAVAPEIDWLNPPTLVHYNVFSPNQVSNGQSHYSETLGNGAATTFTITHGLDTAFVDVIILENTTPGSKMVEGTDYTWERDNENQVTITWLIGTPTAAQYTVTVLGLAMTSFFDAHTHVIADVDGLQEWIDSVEERFALLNANTGGGFPKETGSEGEEAARWQFPKVWELYPSRVQPTRPESGLIADLDLTERDENEKLIINRGRGLFPAVHDATVTALPDPLPDPDIAYAGSVYQNQTGGDVILPGGYGNRAVTIKDQEYAACDGDRAWYPVTPHARYAGYAFTATHGTDLFTFTSELAEPLEAGRAVELETTGTLPSGVTTGTTYYVVNPDLVNRTFQLSATLGGTAINITTNGTGTHTIVVPEEITYYPTHFERTLFTIHVNEKQLRAKKNLFIGFSFEAALFKNNLDAMWHVALEIGEPRGVTTAGTEGSNLDEIVWRKLPFLEQAIHLSNISTTHKFGMKISRRTIEGVDTFTAWRYVYGALESGALPPRTANFSVRGVLRRFDTSDNQADGKGLLMLSGLNVTRESGEPSTSDFELGYAVIK
jgi:hypothetical protein